MVLTCQSNAIGKAHGLAQLSPGSAQGQVLCTSLYTVHLRRRPGDKLFHLGLTAVEVLLLATATAPPVHYHACQYDVWNTIRKRHRHTRTSPNAACKLEHVACVLSYCLKTLVTAKHRVNACEFLGDHPSLT